MKQEGDASQSLVPIAKLPVWYDNNQTLEMAKVVEPEYVVSYRGRRGWYARRWLSLVFQLTQAGILAGLLYLLPDFSLDALHTWKNPLIVFLLVCYLGKILLDTLFYDHYRP